jgi:hypothetical protein
MQIAGSSTSSRILFFSLSSFFQPHPRWLWILSASRAFARVRFITRNSYGSVERARATETPEDARGIIFSSVRAERSSPSLPARRAYVTTITFYGPGMQRRRNKIGGMWSEYRDGALFCGRRKTAETIARERCLAGVRPARFAECASANVDWRKFIEMPLEYGSIR